MLRIPLLLYLLFFGLISCTRSQSPKETSNTSSTQNPNDTTSLIAENPEPEVLKFKPKFSRDTSLSFKFGKRDYYVHLRRPQDSLEHRGCLLLLPGWNYKSQEWCTKTKICSLALNSGYTLILADMEKSTYSDSIYPQTRPDWQQYPTRTWLSQEVFPVLQEEWGVLQRGDNNFVLGLSTGGRGAALLGLHASDIFKAVAALSADFDQRLMPNDAIMRGFYGNLKDFPQRWAGPDNLVLQAKDWILPVYLGHGLLDKVSPPEQTKIFIRTLQTEAKVKVIYNLPKNHAHDYRYWASEAEPVWNFFLNYETLVPSPILD